MNVILYESNYVRFREIWRDSVNHAPLCYVQGVVALVWKPAKKDKSGVDFTASTLYFIIASRLKKVRWVVGWG